MPYTSYTNRDEKPYDDPDKWLSISHGGWIGPATDTVPVRVAKKIEAFVQSREPVLHIDEVLNNKKDVHQVRLLFQRLLEEKVPVQVCFLQGAIPLQGDAAFAQLMRLLHECSVWSINLGELRFSEAQCAKLAETLKKSGVTHMFYECTVAGQWKETYRSTIRDNRWKHGLWRFGPDEEQNDVVRQSVKNWFNPENHQCNKDWSARHKGGWTAVERVQCEACGKWRRLPSTIDGWPREFYCVENTWEPRYALPRPPPPRPPPPRPPAALPLSHAHAPRAAATRRARRRRRSGSATCLRRATR